MSPEAYAIRPVRPEDVPAVVGMVHELAEFERAAHLCRLTTDQLQTALFSPGPKLFGHVGVDSAGQPHGFAVWLLNFSTWAGTHGIHLEDLYVRPAARGTGLGRDLLATLAGICVARGYARLEWNVLDWNPAREFYATVGATVVDGWVPYRLSGSSLDELARRAPEHAG